MKTTKRQLLLLTAAVCILAAGINKETVHASGERVYFGSESYEWELNLEDPSLLGVYASADEQIQSAEFYVLYDPDMLEFVSGGEEVESGKILVQSDQTGETEFRRMMTLKPLMGGHTEVQIRDASIKSADQEETAADATVPVDVTMPRGCILDSISVNGEPVKNFDGTVPDYTIDLDQYTEQADITVEPQNPDTEISDTALEAGENEIYITTEDDQGNRARYTLHINNPEETVGAETNETTAAQEESGKTDSNKDEQIEQQTTLSTWTGYMKDMVQNHKGWTVAAVVLLGALIVLTILKVRIAQQWKKNSDDKQRSGISKAASEHNEKQERQNKKDNTSDLESIMPDAGLLTDFTELKLPDPVILPMQKDSVQQAQEKINLEMKNLTEEDLRQASDFMEEDELEIDVDHVTIEFKRDKDESSSIKELVIRTIQGKRSVETFRALNDISFQVMKGEVVGIIGTNGSGKSTILKIISGVLYPTKGKVTVDKHKIQLLTLGTGFDSELTGRENVYLNGALIGYTKEYIDEKYEDIVKFAELEGFMDEKVKNYSSGMVSRLGFAIATARDTPEILILDEVLSVGDMFFRKKSEARIQEMIHGGSTVLIVSHSTSVIRKNCTKVVWIEKGQLRAVGDPKEVCAAYEKMNR